MASSEAQQEFDNLMRSKEQHSRHPEDDDNSEVEEEEVAQVEQAPFEPVPRPSMSSTRDVVPRTKYGANTGPKGVISDAQNFQESRRSQQTARTSTSRPPTEPTINLGQRLALEKLAEAEEQGDFEDDGEDDDEFMAQWRQQRLQALQRGGYSSTMHDKSNDRKLYGGLVDVDGERYLEAIEGSGANTVVVVYIYDDASEVSQLFEDCLRILANKHRTTRFIKLDYEEAEIQAAGVPGIIAYRGGEKFAALIPVLDEMPEDGDLDATTLENVLQKHQMLT